MIDWIELANPTNLTDRANPLNPTQDPAKDVSMIIDSFVSPDRIIF
ncbi:MAG: hypothetical protein HC795_15145 [Coleofasciculaceae cyanobacterium RL_1_1]|nr:hypothetical protein [Coleofasciculaceae cyanobacterium RL_1_1]